MNKDKDLELIKSGRGLADSSVTGGEKQVQGTTTEQRNQNPGTRKDNFTRNDENKKDKK